MKTETQVAKVNVENKKATGYGLAFCMEHKTTCKRWLEFLESLEILTGSWDMKNKKIIDLKNAIKVYGENGI